MAKSTRERLCKDDTIKWYWYDIYLAWPLHTHENVRLYTHMSSTFGLYTVDVDLVWWPDLGDLIHWCSTSTRTYVNINKSYKIVLGIISEIIWFRWRLNGYHLCWSISLQDDVKLQVFETMSGGSSSRPGQGVAGTAVLSEVSPTSGDNFRSTPIFYFEWITKHKANLKINKN